MQYNLNPQPQPAMTLADVVQQPPMLYMRDDIGGHRPATPHEILAAASVAIDSVTRVRENLSHPSLVRRFFQMKLAHAVVEYLSIIYLDSSARLIAYDEPFRGTLGQCSVYPREIVRAAMRHNAACVIMAHNHPSGNSQPSQSDVDMTHQIRRALELVDVRLLDHLIIGGNQISSMSEMGLIH